jgi:hypothetical protein
MTEIQIIEEKLLNSIKEIEKQTARLKGIIGPIEDRTPEHIPAGSRSNLLRFHDAIKTELKTVGDLLEQYEEIEKGKP